MSPPNLGETRGQNRRGLVNIDRFAKLSNCVTNQLLVTVKPSQDKVLPSCWYRLRQN